MTPLYKYKNVRNTRDMRVLAASLGFAYHHVMAAANRCRPGKWRSPRWTQKTKEQKTP
jgi:hypothetical protein